MVSLIKGQKKQKGNLGLRENLKINLKRIKEREKEKEENE
jgi:hypothetical protein